MKAANAEVALMLEAERDGRIAAAREVRRRYTRAHGLKPKSPEEIQAQLQATFARYLDSEEAEES
jgi:hypothetical protein